MKSILQTLIVTTFIAAIAAGCGGRKGGLPGGDEGGGGDADPAFCTSGTECRSGICEGGSCVDAVSCTNHGECGASKYCHFPSAPIPWVAGTAGQCSGPCSDDNSCGILGQECHAYQGFKRCYTNIDCNPANNSQDCPPGEVCWQDTRTCKWPPDRCYFPEQCPFGWVCDIDSGTCVDPNALGDCVNDTDCNGKPGCEAGCTCFDGSCQVASTCQPTPAGDTSCGTGNYCAGGVCQPATACPNGQNTCTPYGLVCRGGYCGNPEPCGGTAPNYTCPNGFTCRTNYSPPACFPTDSASCSRDDQCPAGNYCDLFSGTCKTGCRNDAECAGQCGGAAQCYCSNVNLGTQNSPNWTRQCSSTPTTGPGGACNDNTDCSGGTICSYNSSTDAMGCALGIPIGDCSMSCRQACDLLVSQLIDTCPAGEKCGGGGGFESIMMALMQALMGSSTENSAVCYPAP